MSLLRPLESTSGRRSSSRAAAFRRLAVAVTLPAALLGSAVVTGPAARADVPAGPGSITRHSSEGFLTWTVPVGTYSLSLTAVGGSGGHGADGYYSDGGAGGNGSLVAESVSVVPGEVLYLFPGSAASGWTQGSSTGVDPRSGGSGGLTYWGGGAGAGGGGGAATAVTNGSDTLVVAGGGGGGGGGGAESDGSGRAGGAGGTDGVAGWPASGTFAGQGGSGFSLGTSTYQNGQAAQDVPPESYGSGGGGGGAGWDGQNLGGGLAGLSGLDDGWDGFGAGGGGAGGLSYASDPNATIAAASSPGDGYVTLAWTPGVATTSTLSGPASAPYGTAATFSDTITPALLGGPSPTGSVTFEDVDIYTYARRVLGVVPVSNGQATLNADLGAYGQHAVHAIYSGDSTNEPSTSDFVYPTVVVPDVMTLAISPSPVTFGNRVLGSASSKTITLTNTGTVPWNLGGFSSSSAALLVTSPCTTLAPGASCTALVAFQPRVLGPVSATVSVASNFGTTSVTVTGTGVAPKPVVTAISPHQGRKAGGTVVTITGRNLTGVTSIRIGTVAMLSVYCPSATRCTAVTPRGTGIKDIHVVTAGGTSAVVAADRFTYV